jgi:hypothetical protein
MADEYFESTTPAWIETSALSAPALLGAAAGLLLGDLMHPAARRGLGIGVAAMGVVALLPFLVGWPGHRPTQQSRGAPEHPAHPRCRHGLARSR